MAERIFKTDALVLLSRPFGEADRLVTLLTWERGKLDAVARGARKTRSKLAAGVDLFTYGHYLLYRGRSLATVTGQEVREHFLCFREKPELYAYGLFLAELANRMIGGEDPCPAACRLLLEGWRLLGGTPDRMLLCRAYELKLMDVTGYRPHLQGCLECGSAEAVIFSPRQGGLLCGECGRGGDGFRVDRGTAALAGRLLETPLRQVGLLRPRAGQLQELVRINRALLLYHLDIGELNSLRLLEFKPGL